MLVQIVHAGWTVAVLLGQPWPEHSHHVTAENGWATTTTLLQLAATLDDVMFPSKEGQALTLLWDMASIHASLCTMTAMRAVFPHVVLCFLPPRSTSYLQPCDVTVFRSFFCCIQTQASASLACSVLDGTFEGLAMNKAWRRQSAAEWAARAVTDLCDQNQAWTTGRRCLRAHSNDFREAVTEAVALHATEELSSKHIEPEPAEEGPPAWAMAEEFDDDEDCTPPHADADEPELIDMPPAPASAPPMFNMGRCIALRLVNGAGPRQRLQKNCHLHLISASLCCLACRLSRVSWPAPVFPCPDHQQAPRQ